MRSTYGGQGAHEGHLFLDLFLKKQTLGMVTATSRAGIRYRLQNINAILHTRLT